MGPAALTVGIDRVWLQLPFGELRISTAITWLLLLAAVTWRRGPIVAVIVVGAWLFSFEVGYNWLQTIYHHWGVRESVLFTLGWGGWIAAGALAVRSTWRRRDLALAGVSAALALAWALSGFHVNVASSPHIDALGEALNEASKTALAAAWWAASS